MDRFDDIWKNRFNGSDKPIADWGVPDDSVWEGIEPHIEEKPDRKLFWWFSIGAIILLFLFLSILVIFKKEKTAELSNDISKIEATAIDSQLAVNAPKENIIFDREVENNEQENNKVEESISENTKEIIPFKVEEPQTFALASNDFSKKTSIAQSEFINSSIQTSNLNTITEKESAIEKEKLDDLNFLPFLNANLEINTTPSFSFSKIGNRIEPIKRPNIFSIGFSAGAVHWIHRISDQYTSDLSPFDFKSTDDYGWQAAILGGAQLGNYFDLKSGVRLEKVKVGSGHNSDIGYDPTNEVIPNTNTYPTTLATPYGLTAAEFVLNRNSDIGTDEVALKVDFHSNHDITNINVPLELGFYPFGKKKTITPFVTAGVGYNYISKISNEIDRIDTHHSAIVFDKSSQTFANPDIQKSFFDLRAGAGINYKLTNRFQLNLLYDFSRGINPVFELDDYKTVIDRQYYSLELKSSF